VENGKEVFLLLRKTISILSDERGTTFVESALWIALVVLVLAGAGVALANVIKTKYTDIGTSITNVDVPEP
jgi:Flp pilus assembly pilin Flp